MGVKRRRNSGEHNPTFNMARGFAQVTTAPPFSFDDVVLQFFPLEADYEKLEAFVDRTINIAPDFAHFRPIAPMVLLISAHYPKMGLEEGNLGWTAQNELLFTIPVEWYEPRGKDYEFKALAQYAPFIFVSDESSQVEGREVFGWPKVHGWLQPTINNWVHNPRAPRELLNLKTYVFEHLYTNDRYDPETVIQIFQQPPTSFSMLPPSIENPLHPFKSFPTNLENLTANLRRLWDWGFNQTIRNPSSLPTTMRNILDGVLETANSISGNTINLKQLRDAQNPELACYQAITNASMRVTNFQHAGLLGDGQQLSGDLSGGYSIGISRYPSLPIIESLGLVVDDQQMGENDCAVSIVKPIMPFWQQMDMVYAGGENLAWRAAERNGSRWRNRRYVQKMKKYTGGKTAPRQKISAPSDCEIGEEDPHLPYYITEGAAGFQVAEGPFDFPNASFRVLPLLADYNKLAEYLEGKPGEHDEAITNLFTQVPNHYIYFEPAEPKVYLLVSTYGEMTAKRNNMGLWEETAVKFLIPVRVFRGKGQARELLGMGVVAAFDYSNSALGTTTSRELNGWPTVLAEINSLPNTWGEHQGPFAAYAPLIQVKTSMPEALNMGQPFQSHRLMEVVDGQIAGWRDQRAWRQIADTIGTSLKQDVQRMSDVVCGDKAGFDAFQSIALQVFAGEREVHEYSFKQFRDADAPDRACYQSVVRNRANFRVKDFRSLGDRVTVRIFDYPTQPIVQTLGLAHYGPEPGDRQPYYRLLACRPFYFNAHLTTRLGEVVCWRAGNRQWRSLTKSRETRDDVPGLDFVRFINEGESEFSRNKKSNAPQHIDLKMKEWLDDAGPEHCLTEAQINHALSGKFEPHMALHSALSNEWEHWGTPRWYKEADRQAHLKELAKAIANDVIPRVQPQTGDEHEPTVDELAETVDLLSVEHQVRRARLGREALEAEARGPTIEQLPTFVIPTDCVGTEEDRLFPIEERVPGELDPEYWTPPSTEP